MRAFEGSETKGSRTKRSNQVCQVRHEKNFHLAFFFMDACLATADARSRV